MLNYAFKVLWLDILIGTYCERNQLKRISENIDVNEGKVNKKWRELFWNKDNEEKWKNLKKKNKEEKTVIWGEGSWWKNKKRKW